MRTALTIAGSDSSGGAGIQADIKTMITNGVYAMSAITALTAQNTTGVQAILNVTPEFLGQELDSVFQDIYPDAVKIGMVSDKDLIHVIAEKLKQYKAENIVVDPVMVATSGAKLISDDAVEILKQELFPLADVLTPNIPEAEVLVEMSVTNAEEMIEAAGKISETYHCAVLCKGGHSINDANDLLYYDGKYCWFEGKRIDNPNTHGTGCTLSSAIASNLAKGYDLQTAVKRSKQYISGAQDIIRDFENVTVSPITIVASSHCFSMGNLAEAYVQDVSNLMQRSFGQQSAFIQAEENTSDEEKFFINHLQDMQIKELQGYIRIQSPSAVKKYLYENVGLKQCESDGWTYLEVRQTVRRFLNLLFEEKTEGAETAKIMETQSMLEMADKAVDSMDMKLLEEILDEVIDDFVENNQQTDSDSIKSGIQKAVIYIDEHFEENLSLSSLSSQFHVESSYFSKMFRKETGENLMLYICRKRMEKAIEYMRNTERSLTEIAFMVGYDDYTYFNKVFRKMMSISPRDFRNQLEDQKS